MLRKVVNGVLYLLYVGVVVGIFVELAVRGLGMVEHMIFDPMFAPFPASDEIPYIPKPNLKGVRGQGYSIVYTDSLSNRTVEGGETYGPKRPDEFRIALIGDSVTFGVGVRDAKDVFATVAEKLLDERQTRFDVEIFNFGVPAYSVRTMAATLEHRALAIDPDLAVMALIEDDYNLARTPDYDNGYTSGWKPGGILGAIKPYLRGVRSVYVLRMVQGIIREKANARIEDARAAAAALPESFSYVERFVRSARAAGVEPMVLFLPHYKEKAGARVLTKMGVPYVETAPVFEGLDAEKYVASRWESHPNAAAHALIAERWVNDLLERDLIRRAPRTATATAAGSGSPPERPMGGMP